RRAGKISRRLRSRARPVGTDWNCSTTPCCRARRDPRFIASIPPDFASIRRWRNMRRTRGNGSTSAWISPDSFTADCEGTMRIGNRTFYCDKSPSGYQHHGIIALREAIAQSCDIYFYTVGLKIGPDVMAAEARRFHLDQPTGIDLPYEVRRMLIPDPAWKKRVRDEAWFAGDTANMAIGQGDVGVTPMDMACFVA